MGKKSRRHRQVKGLSQREEIQARRTNNQSAVDAQAVGAPTPGIPAPPQLTRQQNRDRKRNLLRSMSKDKWNPARLDAFWDYHNLFLDVIIKNTPTFYTDEDKSFLKDTFKDKEELSFIRILVLHAWCSICWAELKYEDATYCRQLAIKMCNETSEQEKQKFYSLGGSFLKHCLESLKQNSLRTLAKAAGRSDPRVGGEHCDGCGKFVTEYGVDFMACCGRCQLSYYCCKECQKQDWQHGGHKQACRKKGEFKTGDYVYLADPLHIADPNGPICYGSDARLIAPVPKVCASSGETLKPQKWLVSVVNRKLDMELLFVQTKNMRRVRSERWKHKVGKASVLAEVLQGSKLGKLGKSAPAS